jgi:ABC-type multidrug transport system fused ATPase/permease subunit
MFLKNSPILILDETTSALDTETETSIQHSLAELSARRTALMIAHRLATIKRADEEQGKQKHCLPLLDITVVLSPTVW